MKKDDDKIIVMDAYREEAEKCRATIHPLLNPIAWVLGIGMWLMLVYAVLRVGQFLEIWP